MNSLQKAAYLLQNNEHMVISTADISGKPWVSPVFYVYDDDYNLYWVSGKETLHSKNIRENKRVAIVIFGSIPTGEMDGVYFDCEVKELNSEVEVESAIKVLHKRTQPNKYTVHSLTDVTGDAAWRIYEATPKHTFKRLTVVDPVSGQIINIREEIRLEK